MTKLFVKNAPASPTYSLNSYNWQIELTFGEDYDLVSLSMYVSFGTFFWSRQFACVTHVGIHKLSWPLLTLTLALLSLLYMH